jgi:hypothetical protein
VAGWLTAYFVAFVGAGAVIAGMLVTAWQNWGQFRHLITGTLNLLSIPPEVVFLVPVGGFLGVLVALTLDSYKRFQAVLLWVGVAVVSLGVLLPNGILFDLLTQDDAGTGLVLSLVAMFAVLWTTGVVPGRVTDEPPYEFPKAAGYLTTGFWVLVVWGFVHAHVRYRPVAFAQPDGFDFILPSFGGFVFSGTTVLGRGVGLELGAIVLGAFAFRKFVRYENGVNTLVIGPQRSGKTAAFGGLMLYLRNTRDEMLALRDTNLDEIMDVIRQGRFPLSTPVGEIRTLRLPFDTQSRVMKKKVEVESVDFAGESLRGVLYPLVRDSASTVGTEERYYDIDVGGENDTGNVVADGGTTTDDGTGGPDGEAESWEDPAVQYLEQAADDGNVSMVADRGERYFALLESDSTDIRERATRAMVKLDENDDAGLVDEFTGLDAEQRQTLQQVLAERAPPDRSNGGADAATEPGSDTAGDDGGRFDGDGTTETGTDTADDRTDDSRFTQGGDEGGIDGLAYEDIDYDGVPSTWDRAIAALEGSSRPRDVVKNMWGCVNAADRIVVVVPLDDFVAPAIADEVSSRDGGSLPDYAEVGSFSEYPPTEAEKTDVRERLREAGYSGTETLKIFRRTGDERVYWATDMPIRSDRPEEYLAWYRELMKEFHEDKDIVVVGTMADWVATRYEREGNPNPLTDLDRFREHVHEEFLATEGAGFILEDIMQGIRDDHPYLLWYKVEAQTEAGETVERIDTDVQTEVLRGSKQVIDRLSE